MCYLLYIFIEPIKFKFFNMLKLYMNINFVKIKLWYLFIELVIQVYNIMYNLYECLLYAETILYNRGTKKSSDI